MIWFSHLILILINWFPIFDVFLWCTRFGKVYFGEMCGNPFADWQTMYPTLEKICYDTVFTFVDDYDFTERPDLTKDETLENIVPL